MFTVVTHQGQKTFQVPIRKYINSIAYVQKEINTILHGLHALTSTYMNDIICKATSVADLFQKLRVLFEIFVAYNIFIKPIKTYLNYLDVGFLG